MKTIAKNAIYRIPMLGEIARKTRLYWARVALPFRNSCDYWEQRYVKGGTSGDGSYGRLAEFKAEILNAFVAKNQISSVLEFGCGDGHQLSLANYPRYVGVDVSQAAIDLCRERFRDDNTKKFVHLDPSRASDGTPQFRAELVLSLDVIYHLVEDNVYESYMNTLFDAAEKFVIIYSSNKEKAGILPHVRHRKFDTWISEHRPQWAFTEHIPNRYPQRDNAAEGTSQADLFVFANTQSSC